MTTVSKKNLFMTGCNEWKQSYKASNNISKSLHLVSTNGKKDPKTTTSDYYVFGIFGN